MWAAQSLEILPYQRFITSGGMGSMGFGLPASIGTSLCFFPKPVVLVAGDGGFQSNIQELQTVVRNKLPIKIVIFDNGTHGLVRQFQEEFFDGRYQSTFWGYSAPNFESIGSAYGIESKSITTSSEIEDAIAWLWHKPDIPSLLRVKIDTFTNAYPKVKFGSPIYDMSPKK